MLHQFFGFLYFLRGGPDRRKGAREERFLEGFGPSLLSSLSSLFSRLCLLSSPFSLLSSLSSLFSFLSLFSLSLLWISHGCPVDSVWISFGFPGYGFPGYGFPIDFLWISYGSPLESLQVSYTFPMDFLSVPYAFPMRSLFIPVAFPSNPHSMTS